MHLRHPLHLSALAMLILAAGCNAPSTDAPGSAEGATPSSASTMPEATTTPASPAATTTAAAKVTVDAEGLRLVESGSGTATRFAFGNAKETVLAGLERSLGAASQGTNEECGAGPVEFANWPDGLSVAFQDGKFVGWGAAPDGPGGWKTASGIGPGSTRAEVQQAHPDAEMRETTLGTEFSAAEVHGLLEDNAPDSKITFLWAGVSCMAR